MKKEEIKIPTKKVTDKIFKNLKKDIDDGLFKTLNAEEIYVEIKKRMPTDLAMPRYLNSEFNSLSFYRCSTRSLNKEQITKKTEFYYPPQKLVTEERCNIKETPVLYVSIDPYTTIFESRGNEVGNEIYISEWFLDLPNNEHLTEYNFFFFDETIKNKESYAYDYSSMFSYDFKYILKLMGASKKQTDDALYFLENYQDLFRLIGREYYHVTSAISHNIFNKKIIATNIYDGKNEEINFDVISYPSISTNLESVNFAFKKEIADKYIKLKSVIKGVVSKIDETDLKNIEFECSEVGIADENENINWKSFVDIQKSIVIENVFIKQTEGVNGDYIIANDKTISCCCDKHSFTLREYINIMRPNFFKNQKLLKGITNCGQMVMFKPDKQWFLENDFNDSGKINFIGFNCHIPDEYKNYINVILNSFI